jgi:hypothetical protein
MVSINGRRGKTKKTPTVPTRGELLSTYPSTAHTILVCTIMCALDVVGGGKGDCRFAEHVKSRRKVVPIGSDQKPTMPLVFLLMHAANET